MLIFKVTFERFEWNYRMGHIIRGYYFEVLPDLRNRIGKFKRTCNNFKYILAKNYLIKNKLTFSMQNSNAFAETLKAFEWKEFIFGIKATKKIISNCF